MGNKRTYSSRKHNHGERANAWWNSEYLKDGNNIDKRHKIDDKVRYRLPTTPRFKAVKEALGNKKSSKLFSGPMSIPQDDLEDELVFTPPPLHEEKASRNNSDRSTLSAGMTGGRAGGRRPHGLLVVTEPHVENKNQNGMETFLPTTPPCEKSQGSSSNKAGTVSGVSVQKNVEYGQESGSASLTRIKTSQLPRKNILGNGLSERSKEAELWSTNQTKSPFFHLPPKIRNKIYRHVLGGHTINIEFETYRVISHKGYHGPAEYRPVFKYRCWVLGGWVNPFARGAYEQRIGDKFQLLSDVCRQMYHETETLAFGLNFVTFQDYNVMFHMLYMEKRLTRRQLDALTMIGLPNTRPPPNMLVYLSNLDKVFVGHSTPKVGFPKDENNKYHPILKRGVYIVERRKDREPWYV